MHFIVDDPVIEMDYDLEKGLNIASNILSNAIKNTPEGGDIYVRLTIIEKNGHPCVEFKIKDTGIGISEEHLPHIFNRFYQAEEDPSNTQKGSGIGLAMVKELTDLMNGEIEVKSQLGEGTEFTIRFVMTHEAETTNVTFSQSSVKDVVTGYVKPPLEQADLVHVNRHVLEEMPSLLIVEDNDDVVQFIQSCLTEDYNTYVACDGVEGISRALELVPDIIISDILMPKKNGFELCREIKTNEITSHIPVVLLTARDDVDAKLEGLDCGADDYMLKPFNPDELKMRLRNLIRVRRIMQQRYQSSEHGSFSPQTTDNREDVFVENVRKVILERIDDNEYSITQLCRDLGLSRTQLHNKLKAVTGRSASLFIRYIRLHESLKLLKQGELNVSEVAYSVGFKDPSYFSRTFADEFGYPPSKLLL
jgi:DNA-binding response OmpR family regulator